MKIEKQNSPKRVFLKDRRVIGYTGDMECDVLEWNRNFYHWVKRENVPINWTNCHYLLVQLYTIIITFTKNQLHAYYITGKNFYSVWKI